MMRKLPRGLGLTAMAFAWLVASAWLLLLAAPRDSLGGPPTRESTEEPPPPKTIWDRIGDRASVLLRRHEPDTPQEEIRQAAIRMGVVDWHKANQRGGGVKVAVLDSGFRGYRDALGKALPAQVKVKSFRKDGRLEARDSQHGILCAEVIHHLAPDAEILFANWEPERPEQFLEAVRWARREGAQIISCSIIMPSWSDGEGRGAVHKELAGLLGEGTHKTDGLFFASAGNTALRHYGGTFTPGKDGWHQWSSGRKDNTIRPLVTDRVSVELTGPGDACYEMILRDSTTDRDVERVRSVSADGTFTAVARFEPVENHRYLVRLRQIKAGSKNNKEAGRFHLTVLGGKLGSASKSGSIPFPGDGGEVVAVAAVEAKGRRWGYSSCGPNGPSAKPDLCAVVPFPSVWRSEQAFSGTSAAAPQAAALAALVWGKDPKLSANEVRRILEKSATPVAKMHCPETGHGILKMPQVKQ
jgi:hypothetical protein